MGGLSKIANKNAYILNAMPLRKNMLLFGLQIDVQNIYEIPLQKRFFGKICIVCCTSGSRQERRGLKHVFLSSTFSLFSGDCVHS